MHRIDGPYSDHVEGNKDAFLDTLRDQLAAQLGTNQRNILYLNCIRGSIVVFFRLVGNEDDAGYLAEAYKELVKTIEGGEWTLVN